MTKSERLFERFCDHAKLSCERVATASNDGERRPDYQVVGRAGATVFCEIKQFDANQKEAEVERAILAGQVRAYGGEPGRRVREAIRKANPQLRSLSRKKHPAVLVLYSSSIVTRHHTDAYNILTAMRGLDVVSVQVPSNPRERPVFGARRSGPGKKLTRTHNTSTSAIAVLYEAQGHGIVLDVFHNTHAAIPLKTTEINGELVRHFRMSHDESGWEPWEGLA